MLEGTRNLCFVKKLLKPPTNITRSKAVGKNHKKNNTQLNNFSFNRKIIQFSFNVIME